MAEKTERNYKSLPVYLKTHDIISRISYEKKVPKVVVAEAAIMLLDEKLQNGGDINEKPER